MVTEAGRNVAVLRHVHPERRKHEKERGKKKECAVGGDEANAHADPAH